jgi:hypothetical protein
MLSLEQSIDERRYSTCGGENNQGTKKEQDKDNREQPISFSDP